MAKTKSPTPKIDPHVAELASLKDRLARALADYQNLEKRLARDSSSIVRFACLPLLSKLLDVRDHLASACQHLADPSVTLILTELDKLLQDEGVTAIATDGPFDPSVMECTETLSGGKDKVLKVQRVGYRLHDRLLRPARVVVGNGQFNSKNTV